MPIRNQIPDKTLLKSVIQQFTRKGVSAVRIKASVSGGTVTIAGTIDYDHQRRSILNAANSVTGVRNVIDQLCVEKKKRN